MISLTTYTEKSFVVSGENTIIIKDKLKELGGSWNPRLTKEPFKGWVFSLKNLEAVKTLVNEVNKKLGALETISCPKNETPKSTSCSECQKVSEYWKLFIDRKNCDVQSEDDIIRVNGFDFKIRKDPICCERCDHQDGTTSSFSDDKHEYIITSEELDIVFVSSKAIERNMEDDQDDIYRYYRRWSTDIPSQLECDKIFNEILLKGQNTERVIQIFLNFLFMGPGFVEKKKLYRPATINRNEYFIFYSKLSRKDSPQKLKGWW